MRTLLLQGFFTVLLVAQGCSSGDSGDGETGGGAGAGGHSGGHAGSGGVAPTAGKGGAGPDGGRGGHGGSAGASEGGGAGEAGHGGGVCEAPLTARMPWLYATRAAGGGEGGAGGAESGNGAGGVGGSGGDSAGAPCSGSPYEKGGLRCEGSARVHVDSNGARLVFNDGASLLATGAISSDAFVANETVWVRYEEEWLADCPFCGGRSRKVLEARTAAMGTLLTFAQGGERKFDASNDRWPAIREEVFGSSLGSTPGCAYDFEFDCYAVHRTLSEYELATTLPQPIPHGVPTRVVTAAGETFDVLLSTATQTLSRIGSCQDGGEAPDDATFIVSRVRAP